MIVICGMETSATIRWSPDAVPLQLASPVLPNADGVGATDTRTGNGVHGNSSNFQIRSLARWIRSLPIWPNSEGGGVFGSQWGAVPLVSVLQTPASQMFVFKIYLSSPWEADQGFFFFFLGGGINL